MDANGHWYGPSHPPNGGGRSSPRVIIIGAGSRGNGYAKAITESTSGTVVAVAEPLDHRREALGRNYIWQNGKPGSHQSFDGWQSFIAYEKSCRERRQNDGSNSKLSIDAACVCTLDTQHVEIILELVPLGLHILSEKPLATTLNDCLAICRSLAPPDAGLKPLQIFSVGHVLRYSPHNMLLRKLLLDEKVIGDVLSVEHTEPVGWWHFSHSYVRGHWRREDTTAPSLLTKSCHDIDLLLWLLCSPLDPEKGTKPHLPSSVSSIGRRSFFRRSRKPAAAGKATNCLSCPIESTCNYSAKKIYLDKHLSQGVTGWPVDVVDTEIEDIYKSKGADAAKKHLTNRLLQDYDRREMSDEQIKSRNWFGRCVWECDNDVCDDQIVTIAWDEDSEPDPSNAQPRLAKTATFHQIANTEAQCARRGRVYGSKGELSYDSKIIRVFDFGSGEAKEYQPTQLDFNDPIAKHGGGDTGLAQQFIAAVAAVKRGELSVDQAQRRYIGCTPEDVLRSHAMVFAAEDARTSKTVVDWPTWWKDNVESKQASKGPASTSNGTGGWEVVNKPS